MRQWHEQEIPLHRLHVTAKTQNKKIPLTVTKSVLIF